MDILESAKKQIKCLFIGNIYQHATIGRIAAFQSAGCVMKLLNVGIHPLKSEEEYPIPNVEFVRELANKSIDPYYKKIMFKKLGLHRKRQLTEYLRIKGTIPENKKICGFFLQIIRDINPDFVVLHYGTVAMHFARIIKSLIPELPVVVIINLLPSALNNSNKTNKQSLRIELSRYKYLLCELDGVIYTSQDMIDYTKRNFKYIGKNTIVLPDFLPKSFWFRKKKFIHDQDMNKRVIFVGAPERWGSEIDSIDSEFMDIAKEKIHIYSGEIDKEVIDTGFGHQYNYFPDNEIYNGEFASFINQFNAALVTYNNNVIKGNDRFKTTYPTRFLTALTCGIPIAVKKGLTICEKFVLKHNNGFVYHNTNELKDNLFNNEKMKSLRKSAMKFMNEFSAESQSNDIKSFISGILK